MQAKRVKSATAVSALTFDNNSTADDLYEYVMDYQLENQRGAVVFGYALFSSESLMPTDPRPFTRPDGSVSGMRLESLQVPNDKWTWDWDTWFVDMSNDVDDQGWSYSWRFGSSRWHGRHLALRSFVRQRRWKRLRKRELKNETCDENGVTTEFAVDDATLETPESTRVDVEVDVPMTKETSFSPNGITSASTRSTLKSAALRKLSIKPMGDSDDDLSVLTAVAGEAEMGGKKRAKHDKRRDNDSRQKSHSRGGTPGASGGGKRLLNLVKGGRNDRERNQTIVDYLESHPEDLEDVKNSQSLLVQSLDYPVSKNRLTAMLKQGNQACKELAQTLEHTIAAEKAR